MALNNDIPQPAHRSVQTAAANPKAANSNVVELSNDWQQAGGIASALLSRLTIIPSTPAKKSVAEPAYQKGQLEFELDDASHHRQAA